MLRSTICLFIQGDQLLLAMKKRGHGEGKWNGPGGKANPREHIRTAAKREAQEEVGLTPLVFHKVAQLTFKLPRKLQYDQHCSVFLCTKWYGEPTESGEMKPAWFSLDSLPYDSMWQSDSHWLPQVLEGKFIVATVDERTPGTMVYTQRQVATF